MGGQRGVGKGLRDTLRKCRPCSRRESGRRRRSQEFLGEVAEVWRGAVAVGLVAFFELGLGFGGRVAAVGRREGSREGRMPRGTSAQSPGRRRGVAGERRWARGRWWARERWRARERWAGEAEPAGPPRLQGPFCLTKLTNTQLKSGRASLQGNVYFTSREMTSDSTQMWWRLFTIEGQTNYLK